MIIRLLIVAATLGSLLASHPRDDPPDFLRVDEDESLLVPFADDDDKQNYRLNDDTWPSYYKVRINAFMNPAKTYTGEVDITFTATRAVSEFVLNQQNINLTAFQLFRLEEATETEAPPESTEDDRNAQILKLMDDLQALQSEASSMNQEEAEEQATQERQAHQDLVRENLRLILEKIALLRNEPPQEEEEALGRSRRETKNAEEVEVPLQGCVVNGTYEKIICTLAEGQLDTTQTYLIRLSFEAKVHDDMRGFYESYYTVDEGAGIEKRYLDTTHFGQQGRRLLPCWDEPRFKARFEFSVRRYKWRYTNSITNGKFVRKETDPIDSDYEIDYHEPTSRIPAYILALVVSNFQALQDGPPSRAKYSVYVRPNQREQAIFALDALQKTVKAFDEWTDLPYFEFEDVKKIDLASIPDFSAGAMENWGLLIHREVNCMTDERHTTSLQYQRTAVVISHEVAHQWFGDLVTCDWWEATWLNEGFASYFEYVGVVPEYPQWRIMDQFVVDTLQNAMAADASLSAHPLTNPGLYTYADIRTMFTSITYDKGGSILRMLHNLMGVKFQDGIREYLRDNAYKTAKPEDVFTALEKQGSGHPVTEIFTYYSEQAGLPLVTATRDGNRVTLRQSRFLLDTQESVGNLTWSIPITFATKSDDFNSTLANLRIFRRSETEVTFEIPGDSPYFVLNVQAFNYHRTTYDTAGWNAIRQALKSPDFGGIHTLNRAQIVDDLFQLARSGRLTYDFIFGIVDYIAEETEQPPLAAFLNGLNYLQTRIPSNEYQEGFYAFVRETLEPVYKRFSSIADEDKTHLDKIIFIRILDWASKYGIEDARRFALDRFGEAARNIEIDPDLKPGSYCTGLRTTMNNWNFFWEKYVTTNYTTEQATILTALGCASNKKDIGVFLSKILTEDIRPQDKSAAFVRAYSGNLENVDLVLDWIIENHVEWAKTMNLGGTLSDLASRFTREDQVEKLQEFRQTPGLTPGTIVTLETAIARARRNMEWDKERLPEALKYYRRNQDNSAMSLTVSLTLLILSLLITDMVN